jgi:hypothetical protein
MKAAAGDYRSCPRRTDASARRRNQARTRFSPPHPRILQFASAQQSCEPAGEAVADGGRRSSASRPRSLIDAIPSRRRTAAAELIPPAFLVNLTAGSSLASPMHADAGRCLRTFHFLSPPSK